MKKKGLFLMLLVLALTLTAVVATAECAHTSTHWEHDYTTHWLVCDDCGATVDGPGDHQEICTNPDVCVICGESDVAISGWIHESPRWEYDATTHTQVCDACGETIVTEPHFHSCDSDLPADTCSLCGASGVVVGRVSHAWADENGEKYGYDETEHWQLCVVCGEELLRSPHEGSCKDPESGVCAVCGASNVTLENISHAHRHMEHNETEHWQICDDCGEELWRDVHYASCKDPNSTICADCGAENVQIAGVTHGMSIYSADEHEHWAACQDCGEEYDRAPHYRWCTETRTDHCSGCQMDGVVTEVRHENTSVQHDQDTHWTVCDDCGEIISGPDPHYASCVNPDVCMECGASDVNIAWGGVHEHIHWEYDQTTHTQVCDDCGEPTFTAPHNHFCTDTDLDADVCSSCGAEGVEVSGISHNWYYEELGYNETEHWQACYDCGEILWSDPHHGSCTDAESGVCVECGATNVTLAGVIHENRHMEHDDTKHWEVCDDCGEELWWDYHYAPCTDPDSTTCMECGAENVKIADIRHTRYTFNADKTDHWTTCLECGEEYNRGKHYRWCTETRTDFCSQCQLDGLTVSEIRHETMTLLHDQDKHWAVCDNCGEISYEPEAHFTNEGDPEGICSLCGAEYTSASEPTTPPAGTVAINSVTVSGDLKVDSALTATIDATGATYYSFWIYDANNVLIQEAYMTSSNTLSFTLTKPGGYIVFAAATDGTLSATANSGWFVVAGDQVVISSLTLTGTQEVGSAITATVVSPTATAYSYWLYDGQATLLEEVYMTSSNTYTFTPEKPGIYNVFVAVTDGATGAQANTGWFPVKGDPVVINSLTITGDKTPGSPLTATIDAPGATGFSYWFYNADGTLLEEAYMVTTSSYTFTPTVAGGYNIFVAVTDGVSSAQANTGWFLVE